MGCDGSSFRRFALLDRRHAPGHFEALTPGCKNDAVDRRDIGVVAADGEHDVVIAGENAVGRVKPAPANILAAPHQYPGMHRAGALELLFSGRLRGPQITADIGSRQTETSHAGDHDMSEVLSDAPAQRERHGRLARGRSSADFVTESTLNPSAQIVGDSGFPTTLPQPATSIR